MSVERVRKAHPYLRARDVLIALPADRSTVRRLYHMPSTPLPPACACAARHLTPVRSRRALCGLFDTVHKSRFTYTLVAAPVRGARPLGLHPLAAAVARGAKLLLGDLGLRAPWLPTCSSARALCARAGAPLLTSLMATAASLPEPPLRRSSRL